MDDKVIVESMVTGQIYITDPERRTKKIWPKKGTKLPIKKDFLREVIYTPGVEYMFKHGILDFDDLDFKIELGLEDEGAKAPVNTPHVDEKYLNRVLKLMPISEMESSLKKMSTD